MELCFFEPLVKMEIGFRKLGVQKIREILSLVLGLWAFLLFSVWESPMRSKKIQSLQGKENKF